jgi:hypothetical protein
MEDYKVFEIVKEYIVSVKGIDFNIKARIKKDITPGDDLIYFWDVSHYYKPDENSADVYRPSLSFANSLEECERLLLKYLNKFTTYGIKPNDTY